MQARALLDALNAPDENVRANAALALARAGHPQALEACLATLDDAP
jgi:HEAT repeat protein